MPSENRSLDRAERGAGRGWAIRPQTLYAYVSRGRVEAARRSLRIRAAACIGPPTWRRSLADRKARGRRAVSEVAAGAIAWGEPVLSVGDHHGGPAGGCSIAAATRPSLRETESLEAVARLLRGGHGAALSGTDRSAGPGICAGTSRVAGCSPSLADFAPGPTRRPGGAARWPWRWRRPALLDTCRPTPWPGQVGGGAIAIRVWHEAWGLDAEGAAPI
jgi:citrate synthase